MRKEYQRRKDYVVKALNEIDGISCNNPQGAFYIFVNIKSLGKSSQEVAEYMLEHAKIALVPGSAFGSEGEGYLRISYATSYEDLVEACDRIKKAVAELKNN
jgi:aspartate/methionine/tyrosine aminotransferase